MFNQTSAFSQFRSGDSRMKSGKFGVGFLLVTEQDQIIYANEQARRFLGLLADEALPKQLNFLPMVESIFQCYPADAWKGWPHPHSPTPRYLIYRSTTNKSYLRLKVDILEQISLNQTAVWVVSITVLAPDKAGSTLISNC